MHIHVRPSDPLPIYRQIMTQIRDAVVAGIVEAGAKLPSHRELATTLVVAPLTVKKAYDELESEGLVETRRGRGTFVAAGTRITAADRSRRLERAAQRYAEEVALLGFSDTDALAIVRKRLQRRVQPQAS